MRLEDLALIGNCQCSALVDRSGAIVWCCLPRFDSEPVFGTLLDQDEGGRFLAGPAGGGAGTQRYIDNTNIVETTFKTESGSFRVVDFAPRFIQNDRTLRPTQLVRMLEPIEGTPRVRVSCEPRLGWSKALASRNQGSNHIAFGGFAEPVRLTTDIPLSYIGGQPFTLTERRHMILAWNAPVEEALAPLCEHYLGETTRYWRRWVKRCNVPQLYQHEVIRSALALKLHCFEDSGAVVAAMTTSIPEAPGSGSTSDHRYCFLRDAYHALRAFGLLGHFEEREQLLRYLLGVIAAAPGLELMSAYRIDGTPAVDEWVLENWPGFDGDGPVRVGNRAASQTHNEPFSEMALALAPIYLDERFSGERSQSTLDLLERLTRRAIAVARDPATGPHPAPWRTQTLSSTMGWAAADRTAQVAARHAPAIEREFRAEAARIRNEVLLRAWNADQGTFVGHYDGHELDASLLQMAGLRLLPADDPRLRRTVDAIWTNLSKDGWLFRYHHDGVGPPKVADIVCTFWLVEALASIGRMEEAQQVMKHVRGALSPVGLLSQYCDSESLEMRGNFPQAHSLAALINAAFAASPRWPDVL